LIEINWGGRNERSLDPDEGNCEDETIHTRVLVSKQRVSLF